MSELFGAEFLNFSKVSDSDAEFIPLITSEEEQNMNKEVFPEDLPILSLRNNVLFPGVVIPITVGRDMSIKLVNDANKGDKIIGVVSQKNQDEENPDFDDLYKIGTIAQIIKLLRMPDGSTTIIIQGKRRFEMLEETQSKPYLRAKIKVFNEKKFDKKNKELQALIKSVKDIALQIIKESPNIPSEASFALKNIDSPTFLVNFIASNMNADVLKKQEMLEETVIKNRVMKLLEHLSFEMQMLEMRNEIQSKVKKDIDQQQREYFLHQQMRTIQDELGDNPQEQDVRELYQKAKKMKWDGEVKDIFKKEIHKLERMNPQGAEYSVQLNYLDLLLDLPWNHYSKDKLDLKRAIRILNKEHYGLEKVKTRILLILQLLIPLQYLL